MVVTDKYKKGIMALSKRASEFNPMLGEYQSHFINEHAKFIVQLSNGRLEIGIELAREFETNPNKVSEGELKKLAITYKSNYKAGAVTETMWKRLFDDDGLNKTPGETSFDSKFSY